MQKPGRMEIICLPEMLMQIAGDEHDHAKFIIHQIEHNGGTIENTVKDKFHDLKSKIMEHYA